MRDGVQEIREVFERAGSQVALLSNAEVIGHATAGLDAITRPAQAIALVWEPRTVENTSAMLRMLADIAEVGEKRAAENESSTDEDGTVHHSESCDGQSGPCKCG